MSKEIIFVTHNPGKVASAQKFFKEKDIKLEIFDFELNEPRSDDIKIIAKSKLIDAYSLVKKPCFVLDAGFYIEALNDFPKAFCNFALETIGIEGILKLMDGVENRKCYFKECLAYMDNENPNNIKYFYSTIPGTLSLTPRGDDTKKRWSDYWYIFIPEGYDKTWAELGSECGKIGAIEKFAKWV